MASRYVPPHLRNKAKDEKPKPARKPEDGYTLEEVCYQFGIPKPDASTLNSIPGEQHSSAATSKEYQSEEEASKVGECLGFVLVFKDQHPDWPPSIFCKSNLHLLPKSKTPEVVNKDEKEAASADVPSEDVQAGRPAPIHVFTQDSPSLTDLPPSKGKYVDRKNRHLFYFAGNYTIKNVTHIPPKSPELVNLLERKFPPDKTRQAHNWAEGLSTKWAVVEFAKLEGEVDDQREELKNPMEPLKFVKEERSVTEMLEKLRAGDGQSR